MRDSACMRGDARLGPTRKKADSLDTGRGKSTKPLSTIYDRPRHERRPSRLLATASSLGWFSKVIMRQGAADERSVQLMLDSHMSSLPKCSQPILSLSWSSSPFHDGPTHKPHGKTSNLVAIAMPDNAERELRPVPTSPCPAAPSKQCALRCWAGSCRQQRQWEDMAGLLRKNDSEVLPCFLKTTKATPGQCDIARHAMTANIFSCNLLVVEGAMLQLRLSLGSLLGKS